MELKLKFTRDLTNAEMALVLSCVAAEFAQNGMQTITWPERRGVKTRGLYIPGTQQGVGVATLKKS